MGISISYDVEIAQRRIAGRFAPARGRGSMAAARAEIAALGADAARLMVYGSGIGGSYPGSIYGEVFGDQCEVGSTHRLAGLLEDGAGPHLISGNPKLKFWWASEGRMYMPSGGARIDVVNHPGFDGSGAIQEGYDEMCAVTMDVLDSYGLDLVL